jgi:hypothetical protein
MLEANGRIAEAVRYDEESVRLLAPYLLHQPLAFAGSIMASLQDYFRRAEAAGQEVDAELLAPIIQALESIMPQQE